MLKDELQSRLASAGVCADFRPDATEKEIDEWAALVAECAEREKNKRTAENERN